MARVSVSEIILGERLRIAAIIDSPEGMQRPSLAREISLRSPMDADAAIALLAKSPVEENPFVAAMNKEGMGLHSLGASMSAKEKRLAEIQEVGKAYSKAMGYSRV